MSATSNERVARLGADHPDIPPVVLAAAQLLLKTRGPSLAQPTEIARGYWPTVVLVWDLGDQYVEVEVSVTDYEYSGPDQSRLDIRHFDHGAATIIADSLLELIPT